MNRLLRFNRLTRLAVFYRLHFHGRPFCNMYFLHLVYRVGRLQQPIVRSFLAFPLILLLFCPNKLRSFRFILFMSRIQMHYVEQSRLAAFVDVTAQTKKMDIHEPLVLRGKFFLFLIQPCLTHPNGLGDIIPDTPFFDICTCHMILILFRERVSGHLQTRSDTRRQAVLRDRRIAFPVR